MLLFIVIVGEVDRRSVPDYLLVVLLVEFLTDVELVLAEGQKGGFHAVRGLDWVQFEQLYEVNIPKIVVL